MDANNNNDLDNNNNVIPILNNNNQNQINLNNPNAIGEDHVDGPLINNHNINNNNNNNMDVNVLRAASEDEDQDNNAVEHIGANLNRARSAERRHGSYDGDQDADVENANENSRNDAENNGGGNRNGTANATNRNVSDSSQNVATNHISSARKSKKRKRHYNLNKNKKWNKPYKRQKSSNVIKADAENATQNSRNKHLYAKIPKVIFNSKNALHRGGLSKFFLPDKRPRKDIIIPPTKFLLGGNISDPLNLNSLQDEALASMNAATPKSSPITTPPKVEVIIPPNIYDPLHLLDPVDSLEYEKQLVSPIKTRRLNKQRSRKKKIKKHTSSETIAGTSIDNIEAHDLIATDAAIPANANSSPKSTDISHELFDTSDVESSRNKENEASASCAIDIDEKNKVKRDLQLDLSACGASTGRKRKGSFSDNSSCCNGNNAGNTSATKAKLRRFDSKDKIVSPVIPQPGAWKRPPKLLPMGAPRNRNRTTSTSVSEDVISPTDTDNEENGGKRLEASTSEDVKLSSLHVAAAGEECTSELPLPNYESESNSPIENLQFNLSSAKIVNKNASIKYQFGNYAGRYCGFQNLNNFSDVRLTVFMRHAYLFRDKDILDIGCNVGHMTIAVARTLDPKSIVGVDIDKNLIARARRNLSLFQRIPNELLKNSTMQCKSKADEDVPHDELTDKEKMSRKQKFQRHRERYEAESYDFFPISFPISYGGLPNIKQQTESPSSSPSTSAGQNVKNQEQQENRKQVSDPKAMPSTSTQNKADCTNSVDPEAERTNSFPANVFFRTFNYAVTDEAQMAADKQQYDLILCLSLTKWIHLNYGDAGLKLTFRRMFNQLRPGGKLILEAQNWASYKKRKKLTPTIFNNYKNIEFFPNNFHEYLLSPEVGFSHSYALGVPRHASKGFYRPIQLYIKGDFTPSQVRWSDTYHPQTPYEPYRYAHYADPRSTLQSYGSQWGYHNIDGHMAKLNYVRDTPFSLRDNRYNTPSQGVTASTSRYYNPLETDSYLPSYDNEVQTRHYCFASPLYSTVWSPPASGRKSASQTPLFGSIRRVNDTDEQYNMNRKHVYLTPRAFDGSGSSRSIDESNSTSPQTQHIYAIGSSRSVRDIDLDTNTNSPKEHVYAFDDGGSQPPQNDAESDDVN